MKKRTKKETEKLLIACESFYTYIKEFEFDNFKDFLNEDANIDNFKHHIYYEVLEYDILKYGTTKLWFHDIECSSLNDLENIFIAALKE